MSETLPETARTKLKRIPKNGNYKRETIYQILDEGFVCHIGFVAEGQPFVIPTGYARVGGRLLVHGSAASRMMRALSGEIDVCVTVTLIDGLVLARSAFNHSVNYRSVVVFGRAQVIDGEEEKTEALRAFTQHIIPGRWPEVRQPSAKELKATTVLSLPLDEASAKIRTGDPVDDEQDYELDVWAGVIPLKMSVGTPIADSKLRDDILIPSHVSGYKK